MLSPGRTEPIEKYFEVMGELADRGFVVLAHDWRGQGLSQRLLSDPMKGHAHGFADFVSDHAALLDAFSDRLPKPWISLGHSMGATLVMLVLVRAEPRLSGAVMSAPMLEVKTGGVPLVVARGIAWSMARFGRAEDYALSTYDPFADRFEAEGLTHDIGRYHRFKAQLRACPELALGAVTWGWLDAALEAGHAISAPGALEQVGIPVTLVAAGQDRLVWDRASRSAAARLPQGRYVEIAGAFHEILMETDDVRAQFWSAFDKLADVTAPRAAAPPRPRRGSAGRRR